MTETSILNKYPTYLQYYLRENGFCIYFQFCGIRATIGEHSDIFHPYLPKKPEWKTRRKRLKSALYLKVKKCKNFAICSEGFLNEKISVSKHRKGAFRARKTLQKFGYNVLNQMRAVF